MSKSTPPRWIAILIVVISVPLLLCGGGSYLAYRYFNNEKVDQYAGQNLGVYCDGWYFTPGGFQPRLNEPPRKAILEMRENDRKTKRVPKTGQGKVYIRFHSQPPQRAREITPADMTKLRRMKEPSTWNQFAVTTTIYESTDDNLKFEFAGDELVSIVVNMHHHRPETPQLFFCDESGNREFRLPVDLEKIIETFGEENCERDIPRR